jgi:hypothetical protein
MLRYLSVQGATVRETSMDRRAANRAADARMIAAALKRMTFVLGSRIKLSSCAGRVWQSGLKD